MDGSDAKEAALKSSNAAPGTSSAMRQGKYLQHVVEPDQRAVKRVPRPLLEFHSCAAAHDTMGASHSGTCSKNDR